MAEGYFQNGTIKPLGGGLMLVEYTRRLTREFVSAGGLTLSKRSVAWQAARVVDLGEGQWSRDGSRRIPAPCSVGDEVILRDTAGQARELGFLAVGRQLALVHPDDILGVITELASDATTGDMPTMGVDLDNVEVIDERR